MSLTGQQIYEIKSALRGKLALLYGGRSAERSVSLDSAAAVAAALRQHGIDIVEIDTADADWMDRAKQCRHAFIALHGGDGEDGTVQAVLKVLGLSYTGSGVMASALAMDKLRSKQLWQGIGIASPGFVCLDAESHWQQLIDEMPEMMVKPSREGSSIGMRRVNSAKALRDAWHEARKYGEDVLAERYISGPEYTVAIVDEQTLPAIRLEAHNEFYDFDAKYKSDQTEYHCPCGLSAAEEAQLQELSLRAYQSLGCSGWGRVDVMRDADSGEFFVLEVNTVPGMTSHSLVPMAAKAASLSFDQLVLLILAASLGLSFVINKEGNADGN